MTTCGYQEEISFGMSLVVVLICVMFGGNTVMVKISLGGFSVFTAVWLRFLIGAVAIAVWVAITGRRFGVPSGAKRHILLLSVGFTLQFALVFLGIDKTNASRATLIMNTHPVLLLVLSHFFVENDRMTSRKIGIWNFLLIMVSTTP